MPLTQRIREIIDQNSPPELRGYLYRMAEKESGGNPSSSTGSAKGLFQFVPGTARTYGLANPFDAAANTKAMVRLTTDNYNTLAKQLGRNPTYSELSVAHQQGAGTAAKMLTGTGNASRGNLESNQGYDPNPKVAAQKIMNYYGFDKQPVSGATSGVTLASNPLSSAPVDPTLGAGQPVTTGVPYINPAVGTGLTLNTPPAQDYTGSVGLGGGVNMVTPQQVPLTPMGTGADTQLAAATPPAVPAPVPAADDKQQKSLDAGLEQMAKGFTNKIDPTIAAAASQIQSSGLQPNAPNQLSSQLMNTILQGMRRPRGLTLTG